VARPAQGLARLSGSTPDSSGTGLTAAFCREALNLSLAQVPPSVAQTAALLILDTIGCTVGALGVDEGLRHLAAAWVLGESGSVGLWGGGGGSLPPAGAAFLHGNLANLLDAEDTFRNYTHFCAAIVPAALAIAEERASSGAAVLGAVIAGYEAAARLALALPILEAAPQPDGPPKIRWSDNGGHSWVALPAAIACGRLLQLDERKLAQALGLAAYAMPPPTFGHWWSSFPMTMGKYMLYGAAAAAGLTAAAMADAGVTGDPGILEGENGLWRMVGAAAFAPEPLRRPYGDPWWLEQAAFKLYPCSRQIHAALDAAGQAMQQLRQAGLGTADIDEVQLFVQGAVMNRHYQNAAPHDAPTSTFSLPQAAALVLLGVPPGPEWHRAETRARTDVQALKARVRCRELPEATARVAAQLVRPGLAGFERNLARAEIRAAGRSFAATVEHPRGDQWVDAARLTAAEIEDKFRAFTQGLLPRSTAETAIRTCRALADQASIFDLLRPMRAAGS
jgi:2-methylcitrate dehydratase PrpD